MKILFIDDEPHFRIPMLFPQEVWADVYSAHGQNQIEYFLTNFKIDLVCLDHDMPLMGGKDVARMFFWERSIPCVIHSANFPGAKGIKAILDETEVPCIICTCGKQKEWWGEVMTWYNNLKRD